MSYKIIVKTNQQTVKWFQKKSLEKQDQNLEAR